MLLDLIDDIVARFLNPSGMSAPSCETQPATQLWRFRSLDRIVSQHWVVTRMLIFASRLGLACVLALCLGGRTAHAQSAPTPYFMTSWPFGFGRDVGPGQSTNTYGRFDGNDPRGGDFSYMRYNFANGWFATAQSRSLGLSTSNTGQDGVFSNLPSLQSERAQFGYNFQSSTQLPVTVYAGFDTLKYNSGIGGPFDSTSNTTTAYGAHAGVEIQPAPNVSLSLGLGYTQQPGR
jgi:opacity protein-like surface antigen